MILVIGPVLLSIDGRLSFGTLITFNSLMTYFSGPLLRLINIQNLLQESFVAAERVGEILELEREKEEKRQYLKPELIKGKIKFEDVNFGYNNRKLLFTNLNLEILTNSWTAFVGPSGSGKSTLIKLILKFYETQGGTIFLDGKDIRDIDPTYLRSRIGYVPQEIFLFSGTIAENISLHNHNASLDDIIEAAKKAGADNFIQKLPQRYNTILGEHGGGLSGGEKQRLALARALLGNPSLLLVNLNLMNHLQAVMLSIQKCVLFLKFRKLLQTVLKCLKKLEWMKLFLNSAVLKQWKKQLMVRQQRLLFQLIFRILQELFLQFQKLQKRSN